MILLIQTYLAGKYIRWQCLHGMLTSNMLMEVTTAALSQAALTSRPAALCGLRNVNQLVKLLHATLRHLNFIHALPLRKDIHKDAYINTAFMYKMYKTEIKYFQGQLVNKLEHFDKITHIQNLIFGVTRIPENK